MKGFCPSCEKESELVHVQKVEEINVNGEAIPIQVDRFQCQVCGEEFDNPASTYDPLAEAYIEYRRRKGMVQPEQIRTFREKYHLSQKELSDLLGFGGATLSRYENGALQDETHDTILRLILEPNNLEQLILEKTDALSEEKRNAILQNIQKDLQTTAFVLLQRSRAFNLTPSLINGYRKLNIAKVLSAIKILTFGEKVPKTKLNKLLFYADFKHFQLAGSSITGLCYAHLPYGPVPDQYELLFESLLTIDANLLKVEDLNSDYGGEYFSYNTDPGSAGLSLMEVNTLLRVKDHFRNFTARRIVEYSHHEPAYQSTSPNEMISYSFAGTLSI